MIVSFPLVDRNYICLNSQKTLWLEESQDVSEALDYLRNIRKLTDDVIQKFKIGYYPSRLNKFEHNWAGRLIMPLYDAYDNLVVLTSRDFRCKNKEGMPHLHEEFNKSYYLYGLNIAKQHIIKKQSAIVVEGQFDTCTSHVNGFEQTVGILGSSLSIHHVISLTRYCDEIFLTFDRDDAGFRNLSRSIDLYKEYGLSSLNKLFIPVLLPKYKDPDEFLIKEGKDEYQAILENAKKEVSKIGTVSFYEKLKITHPEINKENNGISKSSASRSY